MGVITGTASGGAVFTWDHDSPGFRIQLEFNSAGTQYRINSLGFTGSGSYFGYHFVVAKSDLSGLDFYNDTYTNSNILFHNDGTSHSSSFTTQTGSWQSVPSGTTLNIYAACQMPTCASGLGSGNDSTAAFSPIFTISLYKAYSNTSVTLQSASGTTATFKHSWTAGSETVTVRMRPYDSSDTTAVAAYIDSTTRNGTTRFTGLAAGTSYKLHYFFNDGNTRIPASNYSVLNFKTYSTSIGAVTVGDTTASFALSQSKDSSLAATTITYYITNAAGTVVKASTAVAAGTTVSITGLSPNTTYTIHAYCTGITNASGNADTVVTKSFTTTDTASNPSISITGVTGETITVKAAWSGGSAETVTASIVCNGATKTTTTNGGSVTFTGLSHGTAYSISATFSGTKTGSFGGTKTGSATTEKAYMTVSGTKTKSTTLNFTYSKNSGTITCTKMNYIIYDSAGNVVKAQASATLSTDVSITGLSPNTSYAVQFWLAECTDTVEWQAFTTYAAPSGLTLSITEWTGTSIVVKATWENPAGLTCTVNVSDGTTSKAITNGGTVRFTGYANGTNHTFSASGTDTEGNSLASESKSATTYNATATLGATTTKTQAFKVVESHDSAAPNKSTSLQYRYKVNGAADSTYSAWASCANNTTVTISDLSPNTTYTIQYRINGVEYPSGTNDTVKSISFKTNASWSDLTSSAVATGTTITVTPTWQVNGSTGIVVTVTVNGVSKTSTVSGTSLVFTGLTNGVSYTISCSGTDSESNRLTQANYNCVTYKVQITAVGTSTKAIRFTIAIISGADKSKTLKYKVSGGNAENSDTTYTGQTTTDGLDDNTVYTITAWIDNMRDQNDNLDTVVTITMTTKLLTLENTRCEHHQHSIITVWQAKASGTNYDSDNLTGSYIQFAIASCSNAGFAVAGYQTPKTNGSITGNYQTNKTLTSSGLDYYAHYKITATVTDGHNYATATINCVTTFPFMWIYTDAWHKVMPYIYDGSKWVLAPAFIYNGGWKECNGE